MVFAAVHRLVHRRFHVRIERAGIHGFVERGSGGFVDRLRELILHYAGLHGCA